jgi:rhamnose utilization protein RhaD (predicted bifunctional aldolase and dehydrogenase)
MLENLWKDEEARKFEGYTELVYRANILGQDPSVTNWKGGNISGKYTENDYAGTPIRVLRVKSGSTSRPREGRLRRRRRPSSASTTGRRCRTGHGRHLAHCLTDILEAAVDRDAHALVPAYEHIIHPCGLCALVRRARGRPQVREDLFQEDLVWVEYFRPASPGQPVPRP